MEFTLRCGECSPKGSGTKVKRQQQPHSLRQLLPYAKPWKWHFLLVAVLVIIYNATIVLQPYLVKVAIDNDIAIPHPHPSGLLWLGILYIVTVVLSMLLNISQILLLQHTGQQVIRKIRVDLFAHIESQGMEFFDHNATGRLVTNISSDTETVSQFFTQFFLSVLRDGLSIVMIVFAMFALNIRIALETMAVIPLIFGISLIFRRWLHDAYQVTRTRLANVVAFLAENLSGMRIIQIFHQEEAQAREFEQLNLQYRRANVKEYGVSVMFNRSLELLGNLAVAAVVFAGGVAVLHRMILFGTLYAFISYIRQFFQPINSLTQQWNTLQSSMVAADRIGRIFMAESKIRNPQRAMSLPVVEGQIDFQNVSFAYKLGEPVLNNVSFTVKPGQFVGFVGATGAGKSTIMGLLTRLYDPVSGGILLDGVDIKSLTLTQLHREIGMVQQELQLFTGTIADNLRLFRPEISDGQIRQAAKAVGIHDFIMQLPAGYEAKLYAKGANLSMGERQLLAFARLLTLDPRVLILDEATASLDSQTEELVQRGLQTLTKNRTTLVIAHRLSTIRHADVIYVLEHGQIVEQGTHDELIRQAGVYAALSSHAGVPQLA